MSERIKSLIAQKRDSTEIKKEAIAEGMTTMLEDGMDKCAKGLTTVKEVHRATKAEAT
jgi:type II secretory ATPase GspE/PulE/Tfp pilus assembly ATPase PilB-like protein